MRRVINRVMLITILIMIALTGTVKAGYQANKNTASRVNVTADGFFEGIRAMEGHGGTLGKEAKIDTENNTYLDSSNNGIDCHMAKNTEWGTAALLAASIYGKVTSGNNEASTTGNETGVYQMGNVTLEYVAGIWTTSPTKTYISKILGADKRYRNEYTSQTPIAGDGLIETAGWYKADRSDFVSSSDPLFSRSCAALFGCYNDRGYGSSGIGSRAVVVCGAGL